MGIKSMWLRPLRLGIIAGTIMGCISVLLRILPSGYIDYRLYSTFFSKSARVVDVNIGLAVGIIYVLMLAWEVSGRLKSVPRRAVRTASVLVAAGLLYHTSDLASAMGDPDIRALTISFLNETKLQLLGALACLALGGFVLNRVHSSRPVGKQAWTGMTCGRAVTFIGDRNHLAMIFLILALAANLTAGYFAVTAAAWVKGKPNLILVMFDTCRADQLGCYGYPRETSPNVDKFSSGAMRFERAVSQASITGPSVGSFMTSRYPQSIIIPEMKNMPGIPDELPTLAEVLKDHGYSTSAVISNLLTQRRMGFAQGFDYYNEQMMYDDVTSPGVFELGTKRLARIKDRPFFMFLLFMDPHTPYIKHKEYNFDPGYRGKLGPKVEIRENEALIASKIVPARDVTHLRALYDGEVRFTDAYFGRLVEWLMEQGLYDNSMIVFLGDHGEEFLEHGRLLHGYTVYNEVTRVPLVVKLPKQARGAVVHGTFPLIDLAPSVLAYLGLNPSDMRPHGSAVDFQGLSSLPDEPVFTAQDTPFGKLWAVQDSRYKLIWNTGDGSARLFDLKTDSGEKHDIARSEPRVARSLLQAATNIEERVGWSAVNAGRIGLSPEMFNEREMERLRSLGYAQ